MAQTTQELINDLEANADRLRKQLFAVNESLREAQLNRVFETYGLRVGSIVEYRGAQFKVISLRHLDWGIPWAYGVKRKKDGEWSAKEQCLYGDWKLITS